MTTVLLDTHTLVWSSLEPERLSPLAAKTITEADEAAIASVTWYEIAWLVRHDRVHISSSLDLWLTELSTQVRTVPISPAIAVTAADLPSTFPGDPTDRIIYATSIENGWRLVTKDERLRAHRHSRPVTIW